MLYTGRGHDFFGTYYLEHGFYSIARLKLGDDTERRVPTLGLVNTWSAWLRHPNHGKLILSGQAFHDIEHFPMFVGRWFTR